MDYGTTAVAREQLGFPCNERTSNSETDAVCRGYIKRASGLQ
jgi:hypothetical protein